MIFCVVGRGVDAERGRCWCGREDTLGVGPRGCRTLKRRVVRLAGGRSGARVHHMLGAADGALRVRALDSLRRRGLPRGLARRAQAVRTRPDPACTGKLSIGCIHAVLSRCAWVGGVFRVDMCFGAMALLDPSSGVFKTQP
jgi:hypothetical protein